MLRRKIQIYSMGGNENRIIFSVGDGDIYDYEGRNLTQDENGKIIIDGLEITLDDAHRVPARSGTPNTSVSSAPSPQITMTAGRRATVHTGGLTAPAGSVLRIGGDDPGGVRIVHKQSEVPVVPSRMPRAKPQKRAQIVVDGDFTMGNGSVSWTNQGKTATYQGNSITSTPDGDLIIIGGITRSASNNRVRPAAQTTTRTDVSTSQPASEEKKLSPEEIFMRDCPAPTREHLQELARKQKHSEIIEELKLSPTELALFKDKCVDSRTSKIMDRPVCLRGKFYCDLETLLSFNGIDPNTNTPFSATDVTSGRMIVAHFKTIVGNIKKTRAEALATPVTGSPSPSNDPSLNNDAMNASLQSTTTVVVSSLSSRQDETASLTHNNESELAVGHGEEPSTVTKVADEASVIEKPAVVFPPKIPDEKFTSAQHDLLPHTANEPSVVDNTKQAQQPREKMKISEKQRKAASLYWANKLLNYTHSYILGTKAPPQKVRVFRDTLYRMLAKSEITSVLSFDMSGSDNLLQQAASKADIDDFFLPVDKLKMTFDHDENLIVGGEKINADDILKTEQLFIKETEETSEQRLPTSSTASITTTKRSSIQSDASTKLSVRSKISADAAVDPSGTQQQASVEKSFSVVFTRDDEEKMRPTLNKTSSDNKGSSDISGEKFRSLCFKEI